MTDDDKPRPLAAAWTAVPPRRDWMALMPSISRISGRLFEQNAQLAVAMAVMHGRWLTPQLSDQLTRLQELGIKIRDQYGPPNWIGMRLSSTRAIAACTAQHGIPLAWCPPGPILTEVLGVDDLDGRLDVLRAHRTEILDDCAARVLEVTTPLLDPAAKATAEAARALAASHDMAAQALSATVVDTLVTQLYGMPTGPTTFRHRNRLDDETTLRQLRTAIVLAAAEHALVSYRRGAPLPTTFNRNASAHTVDPAQFTDGNALVGVMLATSMVREAHELFDAGVFRVAS